MKPYLIIPAAALLLSSCLQKKETVTVEAEETVADTGAKPYPLKTCIVSGEELGSMGDAVSIVHEGQTIKFCCDACIPKFKQDPAKYLSKLVK
ncbi:hypothetical protein HZ994_16645 [Akkermansiaceae bacterium]|nr:hypothetical protein HZ994_16645 [Akkermansiaceae bacterium]